MKKIILLGMFVMATFVISCNSSQKTTNETSKATTTNVRNSKGNLIDGNWEANYIQNTPKAFDELYPRVKPSIIINSFENSISGVSGCNNFTGKCMINGNKINISDALGATRKMCPDMTGEQLFMETLKKVTTYSVTNQGKTLNLIMGDMAIMRLQRK